MEEFCRNSRGTACGSWGGTRLRNFQFCMWWGEHLKAKVFHLFLGCYSYPSFRSLISWLWGALIFTETTQEGLWKSSELSLAALCYVSFLVLLEFRFARDLLVSYKGLKIICLSCKITFFISYLFCSKLNSSSVSSYDFQLMFFLWWCLYWEVCIDNQKVKTIYRFNFRMFEKKDCVC